MVSIPPNGFEGLLGDLLKAMGGAPATAWFEAAKGLAHSVVADEQTGYNPDPVARIRLEELARVVTMHLEETTGLVGGDVEPVTRDAWAAAALASWRARLEPLIESATAAPPLPVEPDDPSGAMLARFAQSMGPMFVGLQVGSAAGHLAERALGASEFPLPWPEAGHALIVPRNIQQFADEWSLDRDAVAAFTVARELAAHAIYARPEIAERVETLLAATLGAQMDAQRSLLERLADADSVEHLASLLGDPDALVEGLSGLEPAVGGPAHDALNAAVTALAAYFDEIARVVAGRVLGDAGPLAEAWRRYRAGDSKGAEVSASLFGVDLGRDRVDLGAAFVAGVTDRDGFEALARLVANPDALPTPAEIVAPGLWLARTSLPELDAGDA